MYDPVPKLHEAIQTCVAHFAGIERVNRYEAMSEALKCLSDDRCRDAFTADYDLACRLWEEISPDPVLTQYEFDYQWLTQLKKFVALKDHTLCPVPWMQQTVRENGMVSVCCNASDDAVLRDDGTPFRITDGDSVNDVVNSRFMREIKKEMVSGQWPQICRGCEISEQSGFSYRTMKHLVFDPDEFSGLLSRTEADGTSPPIVSGMHYILGNRCNLKCRMCGPWASSKWVGEAKLVWGENFPAEQFRGQDYRWYEDPVAQQNLLDCLPDLKVLHLTGGEPLVIPEMYQILHQIIDAGESHHVRLIYNTNVTKIPAELRSVWPQFDGVELFCSIDGFGAVNDYIRSPSQWSEVSGNLRELNDHFDEYGLETLKIGCTVQVYNILMLKDLVDYLLESNLDHVKFLSLSPLHQPEHFNIRILPAELRRLAADRLREVQQLCRTAASERGIAFDVNFENLFQVLEEPEHKNAVALRAEFQRITRALDEHRTENLLDVVPDLAPLMSL